MADEDTIIERLLPLASDRRNQRPCLTVLSGDVAGSVHRLERGETVIGRSSGADLMLAEGGVSRMHAKVVRDSDGTLVLTSGPPTEGTAFTVTVAQSVKKPCLIIDLAGIYDPREVVEWLARHGIRILNVAGPRAGRVPGIHEEALRFLESVFPY